MESGKNTCSITTILIDRRYNKSAMGPQRNFKLYHNYLRYGIDQMSPKVIFTSQHLVPKLQTILSSFSNQIEFVVYFENILKKNAVFEENESTNSSPSILPLSKIESSGKLIRENNPEKKVGNTF